MSSQSRGSQAEGWAEGSEMEEAAMAGAMATEGGETDLEESETERAEMEGVAGREAVALAVACRTQLHLRRWSNQARCFRHPTTSRHAREGAGRG